MQFVATSASAVSLWHRLKLNAFVLESRWVYSLFYILLCCCMRRLASAFAADFSNWLNLSRCAGARKVAVRGSNDSVTWLSVRNVTLTVWFSQYSRAYDIRRTFLHFIHSYPLRKLNCNMKCMAHVRRVLSVWVCDSANMPHGASTEIMKN